MKNKIFTFTQNLFLSMLVFAFLLAGCGGTKPDDELSTEEKQKQELEKKQSSDKSGDEVEDLFGIKKKEKKQAPQPATQAPAPQQEPIKVVEKPEEQPSVDQQKLTDLENELRRKDSEIVNLKQDANQKQTTIQQLQGELVKKQAQAAPPPSRPVTVGAYTPSISSAEFETRYQGALGLFNSRNYDGSLAEFQAILSADSRHTLSGNAQYWIGECHYAQKKYDQAVVDFEKVFTFINTPKKDDSQFKLGLCYLRMKDYNHAKEELSRLISNYPESEYISKAKELLNQIGSK